MSDWVAVVTRANRAIGLEVAGRLAGAGDIVILTARDRRKAQDAAETLSGIGAVGAVSRTSSMSPILNFRRSSCIYSVPGLLCHCNKENSLMLTPNATYPFFLLAGRTRAHMRGIDVATPDENVTLAVRHPR
jgi:NAD(P)-dependent dehydrogenase (short-subunit alcohol dehydrogenase family)